jgi:signal peptidase I
MLFVLVVALGAWVLRNLLVAPFSIPSGSMLPTMWVGDYLFVTKWNYGYSRYSFMGEFPPVQGRVLERLPERGDVVIFKRPDAEGRDWVKRVIGLPGDTVAVRGGVVILNGEPLRQVAAGTVDIAVSANSPCKGVSGARLELVMKDGAPACRITVLRETLPGGRSHLIMDQVPSSAGDYFAPRTVPPGHLFMLGDNRDDSADSRFTLAEGGIGMVPVDRLVGRAAMAFWSTDGSADYRNPISWFTALRWDRLLTSYRS